VTTRMLTIDDSSAGERINQKEHAGRIFPSRTPTLHLSKLLTRGHMQVRARRELLGHNASAAAIQVCRAR